MALRHVLCWCCEQQYRRHLDLTYAESRLFPAETRMEVNNTIEQVIAIILHVWLPWEEISKDFGQVLKSKTHRCSPDIPYYFTRCIIYIALALLVCYIRNIWFWKLNSLKTEFTESSVNYETCLWIQIRKSSLDKCCTFLVFLHFSCFLIALIMQKDWPWPECCESLYFQN